MTLKGYNFWLDRVTRLNQNGPVPDGVFTLDGLDSDTDYSDRITSTPVDDAGNEGPHSLVLLPGSLKTLAHAPGDAMSPTLQTAIDGIVTASMAESGQPGIVLQVSSPEHGDYAQAYGVTAGSGSRPITTDDKFRMGSTTKTFTVTAFFQAMDKGLVTLQDTLEQYVPGVPNGNIITMEHLLSMRSGVFDYFQAWLVKIIFTAFPTWPWKDTGKDALQFIKGASQFTPGQGYMYTNSNYVLIGLVLEAVDPAHRHIRDIIRQDIIEPLGLTETLWPSGNSVPLPAAGAAQVNPELYGAAGAMTTTIGDLTKWAKALRDHTLISETAFDLWTSVFWEHETGWGKWAINGEYIPLVYGYGLGAENFGEWFGHPGVIPNWGTFCFFNKTNGTVIVGSENATSSAPPLPIQTRIGTRIALLLHPGSMVPLNYASSPKTATLNVAPVFSAIGFSGSTARAALRVAPAFRAVNDKVSAARSATLLVAPVFVGDGIPAGQQIARLTMAPVLSATGAERYARTATLTLAPAVKATGVGHTVTPVAFDAASGPSSVNSSISLSHTATAGATVIVPVMILGNESVSSITYAGTAMTQVGSGVALNNDGATGWLRFYKIEGVAGGTSTIAISKTGGGSIWMNAAAVSYLNVGSASATLASTFGSGTSLSQSATSVSNGMVVQAFAFDKRTSAGSPSGGTNRIAFSNLAAGSLIVNDSPTSDTFAATPTTSASWAGAYVVLNPA